MGVKTMNLGQSEEPKKEETLFEWADKQKNIAFDSGINWGDAYFLTEEQKDKFIELYVKGNAAPRYHITKMKGLTDMNLSGILRIRQWFNNPQLFSGKDEKERIISCITNAQKTGKFTGIHPDAYQGLLDKLNAMPDTPDLEHYNIHFHY